eukprot:2645611-Rhodomonas_salina.1
MKAKASRDPSNEWEARYRHMAQEDAQAGQYSRSVQRFEGLRSVAKCFARGWKLESGDAVCRAACADGGVVVRGAMALC